MTIDTLFTSPWSWLIVAYLLGSISSAVIVSRLLGLPDPRTVGSNNPGATNVFRFGGKVGGLLTFVGDALKGYLPVLVALLFVEEPVLVSAAFLGALLGHLFPLYFRFVGGKGVATMIGGLWALDPILGLIFIGIWLFVALLSRYSSLASIFSAIMMPILAFWVLSPIYAPPLCVFSLLLVAKHHENIRRLLQGRESQINFNKLKAKN
ncbi:MAG: acyl-phosphate glycerol 3-phosphate acyltransferase [Legionellales bacterium]|nr:acyl-phosphate glycerol 3-phosphate acyltransferase [Legionellales bacterium]|tara:strand:- start:259 stop:882 length:624 start_codon:yes stop_codon:yes gene_type:complete